MTITNHLRGDIALQLGGETLTLRPTFTALAEIESQTNASLIALARKLANGEARLRELELIIAAGLRGAGAPVPEDLPLSLASAGPLAVCEQLLTFLIGAITGEKYVRNNDHGS